MTSRVGPKGQVVLPKRLRDKFGIQPGDEVMVDERDGGITVRKVPPVEELWGALRESDARPLEDLEEEHRRELRRDERRLRERGG